MHSRGDLIAPLEAGRAMASAIPDARFVVLPGRNHVLLEDDPAADRFWEETSLFLQH
jgi:pimeloyl-ACP methyl ester carboxylesterase